MKNPSAYYLMLLLCSACSQADTKMSDHTIDLATPLQNKQNEVQQLSTYADSIWYVPLQTDVDCFIKNVSIPLLENNRIYIYDWFIFQFMMFSADNGSYLGDVGRLGQGPGEYTYIRKVDYSPVSKRFLVQCNGPILLYDVNGKYLKKIRVEEIPKHLALGSYELDSNTYLTDVCSPFTAQYKYALYDSLGHVKSIVTDATPLIKEEFHFGGIRDLAFVTRCGNDIHYVKPYNDTIYTISADGSTTPTYVFYYGKFKEPLDRTNIDHYLHFDNFINLISILESTQDLFFHINLGKYAMETTKRRIWTRNKIKENYIDKSCFAIYSKKEGKLAYLKQPVKNFPGLANDLDGGPPFFPQYISTDGYMLSTMTVDELVEWQKQAKHLPESLQRIVENMKEDDNPIAVIVKMKKK